MPVEGLFPLPKLKSPFLPVAISTLYHDLKMQEIESSEDEGSMAEPNHSVTSESCKYVVFFLGSMGAGVSV